MKLKPTLCTRLPPENAASTPLLAGVFPPDGSFAAASARLLIAGLRNR
jgi:hypothetical protein